jgi:hypothetical protein
MLLKQIKWIILFAILFSSLASSQVFLFNNRAQQKDMQFLISYLQNKQPTKEQTQHAIKIIKQAQTFFIHYEGDSLIQDTVWRNQVNLDWVNVVPLTLHYNDKKYPQVDIVIRPLDATSPSSEKILVYIHQPVLSGYLPISGYITYTPSLEIKKISFEKCKPIIINIANDLYQLKTTYKQLQNYDTTNANLGSWENQYESYPGYPRLMYRFGIGKAIPNTKGATEKTTDYWCEISIWFQPTTGQMDPQIYPRKFYPRQGITACCIVQAGSEYKDFTTEVYKIINTELKPLEKYEKELDQN